MQHVFKVSEGTAARRRILVYLVDDTDGKTAETGVTISAGDVKISKNGAAEGNHAGTLTELASGRYYYEFTSGEVDTVGFLSFALVKSGIRAFVTSAQVVSFDPYDSVRLGLTALPNAAAEAAGGLYTRGTGAGQINQPANGQIDANVAALTNAIITAAKFAAGAIDANAIADNAIDAGAFAADAITAAKIANGAIDAATFAAGAVDATAFAQGAADKVWATAARALTDKVGFALTAAYDPAKTASQAGDQMALTAAAIDAILDDPSEGSLTLRQMLRIILAAAAGKGDGFPAGPVHYRDQADSKNRITATVDADGNRTVVTVDGS